MRTVIAHSPARRPRAAGAFTIIEVLIVLAIVLALSAIVGVAVFQRQDDAKLNLARTDLNILKQALNQFRFDFERYPTDDEGIAVLWSTETLDPDADETKWKGPYLTEPIPLDRWDNEWGYRGDEPEYGPENGYDLWSNGPDGEEDTEDDITSWTTSDEDGGFADPAGAAPPPPPPGGP